MVTVHGLSAPLPVAHLVGVDVSVDTTDDGDVVMDFSSANANRASTQNALLAAATLASAESMAKDMENEAEAAAASEELSAVNAIPKDAPEVDADYLAKIMGQNAIEKPGPACDILATCKDCVLNRKCAFCATDGTCALIDGGTCKHAWSAFWPRGLTASKLVVDFCNIVEEDYQTDPVKSMFGEDSDES